MGRLIESFAHSMFVGPPGSGKSSLMYRLLRRARKERSLSTGVCTPIIIVDIDVGNPSTFHSVTVIDPNTWKEVECDLSLVRQMNQEASITSPPVLRLTEKVTSQLTEVTHSRAPRTVSSIPEFAPAEDHLMHDRQAKAGMAELAAVTGIRLIFPTVGLKK